MNIFTLFTCIFSQNWLKTGRYVPGYTSFEKECRALFNFPSVSKFWFFVWKDMSALKI